MTYRILSLDGGGSWALIQVRVLLDIYGNLSGHALLRKFDMVIANSGGSLVLACLCNNMYLTDVVSVLSDEAQRRRVFSRLTLAEKLKWRNMISVITRHLGPKYDTRRKLKGIKEILKEHDLHFSSGSINRPVGDFYLDELPALIGSDIKILIVGFDYFKERVTFFRSNLNSKTDLFSLHKFRITLADAVHASSNAPVNYFDAPAEVNLQFSSSESRKKHYWDGAVSGFNNPVLAGLIEATTNNSSLPEVPEYCILSIGTATGGKAIITDYKNSQHPELRRIYELNKDNPLVEAQPKFSFSDDIRKISKSILSDPPDSATFIAYSVLDPSLSNTAKLIRINPCIAPVRNDTGRYLPPGSYATDPESEKSYLKLLNLDMDAVGDDEFQLVNDLCDKYINEEGITNQLIRGTYGERNILGQPSYQEAKNMWKATW